MSFLKQRGRELDSARVFIEAETRRTVTSILTHRANFPTPRRTAAFPPKTLVGNSLFPHVGLLFSPEQGGAFMRAGSPWKHIAYAVINTEVVVKKEVMWKMQATYLFWHLGQKCDDRWVTITRRMGVLHVTQGSPVRW